MAYIVTTGAGIYRNIPDYNKKNEVKTILVEDEKSERGTCPTEDDAIRVAKILLSDGANKVTIQYRRLKSEEN